MAMMQYEEVFKKIDISIIQKCYYH